MLKHPKGSKKLLNAWALYDWANSVYPLVISTAIFPIFYGSVTDDYITFQGIEFKNTALISYVTAFAFLILVNLTPLLSGIADYTGRKKLFMKFFCYSGSAACIMLYWFDIENLETSLMYYFIALIGFWASLVFYNSYLPEIAFKEQQDKISAKGYAMGYIGSVILLLINILMVNMPEFFFINELNGDAQINAMKISFVMVGFWWFLFSQYSFYYLPGKKYYDSIKNESNEHFVRANVFFSGYSKLKEVWHEFKKLDTTKTFLVSFFIYSIALQTVILVATYFGEAEINWGGDDEKRLGLIVSILLIQLVAIIGSVLSARISNKIGNINTLIILNFAWALLCVFGYFVESTTEFYIAAGFVGLVMGAIQSLSRSTYSKLLPKSNNNTSYFSFYDVTQKTSIVIGMTLFATVDQITGSMRNSILLFFIFFVAGALVLIKLNKKKNVV